VPCRDMSKLTFHKCFTNTPKYGFCINLYWHGVFYTSEGVLQEVHTVCTATKGVYDRSACKIINIIRVVGNDDHHVLGRTS